MGVDRKNVCFDWIASPKALFAGVAVLAFVLVVDTTHVVL